MSAFSENPTRHAPSFLHRLRRQLPLSLAIRDAEPRDGDRDGRVGVRRLDRAKIVDVLAVDQMDACPTKRRSHASA